MKQTLLSRITPALAIAFMSLFILATPVGAASPATTETTAFPINGKTKDVGIRDLAVEVIRFLSIGVGIAVVAGIAIGGVTYTMSQGNPAGAQKGMTIIFNAIIGLVLYLLMFSLLQFLVPGGVLS